MSAVKTIFAPNPLAKAVQTPGGRRVALLLARAERNLLTIRGGLIEAMDAHLGVLEETRRGVGPQGATAAELEVLYKAAGDVVTVAGVCGYAPLGLAAYSLCELLDHMREHGFWDAAGLDVHLSALKLFRGDQAPADQTVAEQVLDGLKRISARTSV